MAVGGALGAGVLLLAPPGAFALAVPVLICSAAVLVVLQPRLGALGPRPGAEHSRRRLAVMFCVAPTSATSGRGGVLLLAALAATTASRHQNLPASESGRRRPYDRRAIPADGQAQARQGHDDPGRGTEVRTRPPA